MPGNSNILDIFFDEAGTDGAECSRKVTSGSVLESCMEHCLYLFLHMAGDSVVEGEGEI